jgi:hypothetical protein
LAETVGQFSVLAAPNLAQAELPEANQSAQPDEPFQIVQF